MRRSRKDPTLSSNGSRETFTEDVPWPSWPFIDTPGRTRYINLSKRCPPEFIPLAREFNQLIYMSRLEVRPYTLRSFMQGCRYFIAFLSVLDIESWPSSASKISAVLLQKFEDFMISPEAKRVYSQPANLNSVRNTTGTVRSLLRRGWRAGYFCGENSIDLGRFHRRPRLSERNAETAIYTESEFRRIKMALVEKRRQPRGEGL